MKKLKLNLLTSVLLSTLAPTLLLSGCGGSESDNTDGNANAPVVELAPVSARDGFEVVSPDKPGFVDLSSLIESGKEGVTITDITLESSQGSGQCGEVSIDNTTSFQGFNVTIDGAAICQYTYEVESIAAEPQARMRASARVMVASSGTGSAMLPPISIPIAIDTTQETNIKDALGMDFPKDYTLSPDFSVLGDGDVTADTSAMSISYTATAQGVSRVVYALESNIAGVPDIKMGTLDYTVSGELNNAPTATNFTVAEQTELYTEYDIDVSAYIDDATDADALQLIEVSSYTATVQSKDNNLLTNKVFTFQADSYGMHYVTYTVSDQRGGLATGIVQIRIEDPNAPDLWGDVETDLTLFSAPLTRIEADAKGIVYQGFVSDTNYYPAVDVVTFTFDGANDYCSSIGGHVPGTTELYDLYNDKGPAGQWNWPTGKSYVARGSGVNNWLVSLTDRTEEKLGNNSGYVTCLGTGEQSLTLDKLESRADGVDYTTATVLFVRDGQPVSNANLIVTVTGSATITATSVTTSSLGTAIVAIKNTVAESVEISFTYASNQADISVVKKTVKFIADFNNAHIDSIVLLSDNSQNDGNDQNLFQVTMLDNGGNPVKGATIVVTTSSPYTTSVIGGTGGLMTDDDGKVSFGVVSTEAETVEVQASFNSAFYGDSSQKVISTFLDATAVVPAPELFNYPDAVSFCANMSMRLATYSEYRNSVDQGDTFTEAEYWQHSAIPPLVGHYPYFKVATPTGNFEGSKGALKGGICISTANSGLIGVGLNNGTSTLTSLSSDIAANDTDTADFTVKLLDKYGVAAADEVVYFAVNGNATTPYPLGVTGAAGEVKFSVTDTVAEGVVVSAFYNGTLSSTATFIADVSTAAMAYSSWTTISDGAVADGTDEATLQFTLNDKFGNPVVGEAIDFRIVGGAISVANSTTDADGQVTVIATSTISGNHNVIATYKGGQLTSTTNFRDITNVLRAELAVRRVGTPDIGTTFNVQLWRTDVPQWNSAAPAGAATVRIRTVRPGCYLSKDGYAFTNNTPFLYDNTIEFTLLCAGGSEYAQPLAVTIGTNEIVATIPFFLP